MAQYRLTRAAQADIGRVLHDAMDLQRHIHPPNEWGVDDDPSCGSSSGDAVERRSGHVALGSEPAEPIRIAGEAVDSTAQ